MASAQREAKATGPLEVSTWTFLSLVIRTSLQFFWPRNLLQAAPEPPEWPVALLRNLRMSSIASDGVLTASSAPVQDAGACATASAFRRFEGRENSVELDFGVVGLKAQGVQK